MEGDCHLTASNQVKRDSKPDYVVSVAALVADDPEGVEAFVRECTQVLETHYRYYEIVLLDSICSDSLAERIRTLLGRVPNLRYIRLSSHCGKGMTFTAALDNSLGDYVVLLEMDHDPPSMIPKFIGKLLTGYEIVIGEVVAEAPQRLQRFLLKLAGIVLQCEFRPKAGYFRAFTRAAVNSITKVRSKVPYMIYMGARVGPGRAFLTYEQTSRKTHAPQDRLSTMVSEIVGVIVANSALPLRLASLFGLVASFLNLLYLGYILGVVLIKERIAEGWLTTSVMSTTMFFLLFLILTILSEYIARILDEATDRPLYLVESEASSTTSSFDPDQLNVV